MPAVLSSLRNGLRAALSRRTPPQELPENHAAILADAQRHFESSAKVPLTGLPGFGLRWDTYRAEMRDRITGFTSLADVIAYGQRNGVFDHRTPVQPHNLDRIFVAEHLLKYEFPHFKDAIEAFQDSAASRTDTVYRHEDGRLVSNILYFHLFHLLTSLSLKRDIASICELGGGNGNLARLWLLNPISAVKTYCIVDIAESQFFSECFVRAAVPDIEVVHVDDPAMKIPPATGNRRLIVCPVQCASATQQLRFDLVTNTGSLGEMTDDWVEHWAAWMAKQDAQLFYSHNYFGNPVEHIYEGRSMGAPAPNPAWTLRYTRPLPPLMLLQSIDRRSMEAIFEKTGQDDGVVFGAYARGTAGLRLGLNDLARIVYSAWGPDDLDLVVSLVDRIRADFGYDPVELIGICRRIREALGFARLRQTEQQRIAALHVDLLRRFKEHYPKGVEAP